jgi:hypothetical protein
MFYRQVDKISDTKPEDPSNGQDVPQLVYSDGPKASYVICIEAQVATIRGGLDNQLS